ncbi:MAG TPA: chemotaxis protein CheW [Geobacteraceae bacterium]|nr:chemotaxis protein CheW [Geobacteraceae bacterium]
MGKAENTEMMQFLTFKLDGELFALNIAKVREVLDITTVTRVPRTPEFMLGVINLRGSVVPVVDLRLRFGMRQGERTVNTCIVIAEVLVEGETLVLGVMVDSVQEVIDLSPADIEPAPKIGTRLDMEFIIGMGKLKEKFIIILNIDRLFSSDELAAVWSRAGGEAFMHTDTDSGFDMV